MIQGWHSARQLWYAGRVLALENPIEHVRQRGRATAFTEAGTLIATETPQWYETLTEAERRDCAAELTDVYFSALSSGEWSEFRALTQQWIARAAAKELVTA